MTAGVDPIVINLIVFVLAIFVGYHVVWNVTPALHTPLMSLTNAISSIILVGAMLAAGAADLDWGGWLVVVAVTLGSINVVGGVLGAIVARRVQMTQMPELVAAMHSLVGLAAVLIAIAAVNNPQAMGLDFPITFGHKLELFIGTFIGAITFSGSVIAFGKLSGRIRSAPVVFVGQHYVNLAIGIAMIAFGIWFCIAPSSAQWMPFIIMAALAFL